MSYKHFVWFEKCWTIDGCIIIQMQCLLSQNLSGYTWDSFITSINWTIFWCSQLIDRNHWPIASYLLMINYIEYLHVEFRSVVCRNDWHKSAQRNCCGYFAASYHYWQPLSTRAHLFLGRKWSSFRHHSLLYSIWNGPCLVTRYSTHLCKDSRPFPCPM